MIAVIQRCSRANVKIGQNIVGQIRNGLVIFLGVTKDDNEEDADFLVRKVSGLRIYNDSYKKMNLSIKDVDGSALVISQFTLCADMKKGRRPSFIHAAPPKEGQRLYEYFISSLLKEGMPVESGEFGSMMDVELVNEGPATFILNSKE